MASSLSLLERKRLLDSFGTQYGFASAHTADPGATGILNELTGGSPAYARKAITWAAASDAAPSLPPQRAISFSPFSDSDSTA